MPSLSLTSPTPEPSPIVPNDPLQTPQRSSRNGASAISKGKRKADEVESGNTPPDVKKEREQKATFAISPRPLRASTATTVNSGSTHAPSSFHRQKRPRLSNPSDSRPGSRAGADPAEPHDTAATFGSWSSRKSATAPRPHSRGAQSQHSRTASLHRAPSRRSISQTSIPISALISPHAPSISRSGHTFHMRDPHKPPRVQPTGWALAGAPLDVRGGDGWRRWTEAGGSPLHAWLFFVGFVLFPVWWAASFMPVLQTRRVGKGKADAQVVLDDPQLEFDARTWRKRCRIMAAVSFVTYIPFIILVAVFARRR
ncbi:hypothetical protein B0H15DRAFT_768272 [Mycena belliarum]|uniref:Uncharacterized protein n=1 Tax=Mycena belliarum TaxID=1033014 RepID=A0AAD6XX58_9AGAR|nr:hypothetical protein B0H15DRAFT_768272 [Mycena belliae]